MGLFGLFGTSGKVVARINFGFPPEFETAYRVSLREKGTVPEGFENWIWDLFYAKALYTIGKNQISKDIKSQLEHWAMKTHLYCYLAFQCQQTSFLLLIQIWRSSRAGGVPMKKFASL